MNFKKCFRETIGEHLRMVTSEKTSWLPSMWAWINLFQIFNFFFWFLLHRSIEILCNKNNCTSFLRGMTTVSQLILTPIMRLVKNAECRLKVTGSSYRLQVTGCKLQVTVAQFNIAPIHDISNLLYCRFICYEMLSR